MAVGPVSRLLFAAVAIALERPLDVTRHEQIEIAVVVGIEETGAGAPASGGDAGAGGDVAERPVAIVAIQRIAAEVGHVEIGEAVVVVVGCGGAHAVGILRHARKPRFLGHIHERPISLLAEQPVPVLRVRLVGPPVVRHRIRELRAVREEDVEPAVVVVVEQRDAAPHRFDQVFVRRRRVLLRKADSESGRDIGEPEVFGGTADEAR